MTFTLPVIEPIRTTAHADLAVRVQHVIDHKTKPAGALGRLESLAMQLALIQRSETITLKQPQMIVFAADHGIMTEKVSAYPQEVTAQMVLNMLSGGAAVNVFARQHGFALTLVDAGVATPLPAHPQLVSRKIAHGTRNALLTAAMSPEQLDAALAAGAQIVRTLPGNVIALGEMGIGNTSSAAMLLSRLAIIPLEQTVGRGTGISDTELERKVLILSRAMRRHQAATDAREALRCMGGFEIAMMTGAMLQAAHERRVILVDGFIAGAAALVAVGLSPAVRDYMVFAHQSAEQGHQLMLMHLHAEPLLDLGMRLGEGSGALVAWPLVVSAANFFNEMASFESAGVSGKG
jgi:nicotinate-nucleotide--dimethylbenzimidazole phosphoribosyltransferase